MVVAERIRIDCPRCKGWVTDKGEYLLCVPCGWMEEKEAESRPKPPSTEKQPVHYIPYDLEQDSKKYSNPREGSRDSFKDVSMIDWQGLMYSRDKYSRPSNCQWHDCITQPIGSIIYCHRHRTKIERVEPGAGFGDQRWKDMALPKFLGCVTITYLAYRKTRNEDSWEYIAQWASMIPSRDSPMRIMEWNMRQIRFQMKQDIGDVKFIPDAIESSGLRGWSESKYIGG